MPPDFPLGLTRLVAERDGLDDPTRRGAVPLRSTVGVNGGREAWMVDTPGPERLRLLVAGLHMPVSPAEIEALLAHASAWESEQLKCVALREQLELECLATGSLTWQLAAAQRQAEVLEQDRNWWKENAIRRAKRRAARRSGLP